MKNICKQCGYETKIAKLNTGKDKLCTICGCKLQVMTNTQINKKEINKPSITIVWGERNYVNDNPTRTYRFETEQELNAFLDGINESQGWCDYATIGEGYMFETVNEWRKSNE